MTINGLVALAKSYVAAAKQAGTWNATTDNLYTAVDKIGKMIMLDGQFIDKLPELDGDELPLGKTIEEYFIDLTLPEAYTNITAEGAKNEVPALPSVEQCAYNYTLGREKIKTTVPYDNVERAALNQNDAANMIAKILERLGNSYEKAVAANLVSTIAVPTDTTTGEAFIKAIKEEVEAAPFAHEGGLNGALIGAAPELVLYIKKGVMPSIEVDTMAGAFNEARLAIPARVKVVDDFGTMTNTDVFALLVDPRGIKLHRGYHAIRTATNADGDFVNYVDHSEHTGFISKNVYIKAFKAQ